MKRIIIIHIIIIITSLVNCARAQDPSFSQFFSSPLNINPSLTANINTDWRLIANLRDQWAGPASPYVTGTISYDTKLAASSTQSSGNNYFGMGGMLMYDDAMGGVVKSTYASLNLTYNVNLAYSGESKHRLGVGFGGIYGRRYIDFGSLDFEEQFTGSGFNKNLPTGESALSQMKPYVSLSAGLLYSFSTEISNLDIGAAGFHLNQPNQTFLGDANQRLPVRKVVHANFETVLSNDLVLITNGIYQYQQQANYFSIGGALGYYLGDEGKSLINAGLWYWSKNAIVPYIGLVHKNMQYGLSYDLTISKLSQASKRDPTRVSYPLFFAANESPQVLFNAPGTNATACTQKMS